MSVEMRPGETSLGKAIVLAIAGETRVPSAGSWPSDITVIQPPGIPRGLGLMVKLPRKLAPAASKIRSPAIAVSSARWRFPPAATRSVRPADGVLATVVVKYTRGKVASPTLGTGEVVAKFDFAPDNATALLIVTANARRYVSRCITGFSGCWPTDDPARTPYTPWTVFYIITPTRCRQSVNRFSNTTSRPSSSARRSVGAIRSPKKSGRVCLTRPLEHESSLMLQARYGTTPAIAAEIALISAPGSLPSVPVLWHMLVDESTRLFIVVLVLVAAAPPPTRPTASKLCG